MTRSKTNLSILGAQKNIFFKLNFEFSFGHLFFEVKGRYVKILYKKCTFLRSLFESEKFAAHSPRACGQIQKNFGNWTHKIYLIGDRRHSARFQKSKKVLYHSTLHTMHHEKMVYITSFIAKIMAIKNNF